MSLLSVRVVLSGTKFYVNKVNQYYENCFLPQQALRKVRNG